MKKRRSLWLRLTLAGLLAIGASLTILSSVDNAAYADSLGYPDINKPCVRPPYNVVGSCLEADGSNAYAWGDNHDDESWGNIGSSRGYAYRNCTDYVAWKLQSLGVPDGLTRGLGNGGQWYSNAAYKTGLDRGETPQVGAAAVMVGNPGHVAYVESVNSDGTITVSEYNFDYQGDPHTRTGTPAAMHFTGFVYFGPHMTNPPSGSGSSTSAPPTPHLYEVQHSLTNSGMTEVRGLDASKNYQSWLGGWVTPDGLHGGDAVDYGMADANGDGTQDIYKMQYGYTNSGMAEVMVLDGTQHFTAWVGGWVTPDPYHAVDTVRYAVGKFDGDGKPDVFVILTTNTPSGHVEVKVITGSSNYSQWAGGWVTPEGWHDASGVDYVLSSCGTNGGRPHLYEIQHSATSSGMTEVKELDGSNFYRTYVGGWVTPDGLHDSDSVNYTAGGCNANGKPNIYEVIHQYTNSGMTEVRELDGSANFTAWAGGWTTPDGWHNGSGIDYVMPAY